MTVSDNWIRYVRARCGHPAFAQFVAFALSSAYTINGWAPQSQYLTSDIFDQRSAVKGFIGHVLLSNIATAAPEEKTTTEVRPLNVETQTIQAEIRTLFDEAVELWGKDDAQVLVERSMALALRVRSQADIALSVASFIDPDAGFNVVLVNKGLQRRLSFEVAASKGQVVAYCVDLLSEDKDNWFEMTDETPLLPVSQWLAGVNEQLPPNI